MWSPKLKAREWSDELARNARSSECTCTAQKSCAKPRSMFRRMASSSGGRRPRRHHARRQAAPSGARGPALSPSRFGRGAPSDAGLMAHKLAHVVQYRQASGTVPGVGPRGPLEREAVAAGAHAGSGQAHLVSYPRATRLAEVGSASSRPGLQRRTPGRSGFLIPPRRGGSPSVQVGNGYPVWLGRLCDTTVRRWGSRVPGRTRRRRPRRHTGSLHSR
jgi:hypothetical protein